MGSLDSLLINSILTDSEVWYNVSKNETKELEKVDEQLLRNVLETGKGTPKVMLHLEMVLIPIRFILMKRRLMFLHEEKDSLLHKFFSAQKASPVKGGLVHFQFFHGISFVKI